MRLPTLVDAIDPVAAGWPGWLSIERYRGYTLDLTPVPTFDGFAARAAVYSRYPDSAAVLSPPRGPFATAKEAIDCARIHATNHVDLRVR